ncbi:MAG TPA: hypothetical protein VMS98_04645 [Thermoanaerobaculia bacterium]|nr:hypothetical protein [Thermoanaerobaculia bacterium]
MFPEHIERVFDAYGVRADTKAALFDLYISMGNEVLEVFGDIAEAAGSPQTLAPEDTVAIRERVVERYLRRNHPRWAMGTPTPSLWHPRVAEGRAAGLASPLGSYVEIARHVVGPDQPVPDGMLLLGRNAHYGGREATISFDVVAAGLDDALAIGKATGQQHTIPGSIGETSGSLDFGRNVALIWEVQPNVYKPAGERNRQIAKVYRRHRNWHLVTLACALDWLRQKGAETYILRGEALAATHEVNPGKPVSETIAALHNRTVRQVADAFGLRLEPAEPEALDGSAVMNHALGKHVQEHGAGNAVWRVS